MRRVCLVLMVGMLAAILANAVLAADSPTPSPTPVPIVIEGTITDVTVTGTSTGTITVQVPPPTPSPPVRLVTFAVNERTQLFKDGKKVLLGDIKVGDGCRALLNRASDGTLVALIVYAKTPSPQPLKWAVGIIADKGLWNGTRTFKLRMPTSAVPLWFSVDGSTKISVDGSPAGYDQLANGQTAEVGYVQPPPSMIAVILPILASVVNAKSPPPPPVIHCVGRLLRVDPDNGLITIAAPAGSAPAVFKITNDTKIDKFGPATLADLIPLGPPDPTRPGYPGDMVDVVAKPGADSTTPPVAISVCVLPETAMGVVSRVDPIGSILWLSLRSASMPVISNIDAVLAVPFKIVPATRILKNGMIVPLIKLLRGDTANVRYFQTRSGKVASLVEARTGPILPPPGPVPH